MAFIQKVIGVSLTVTCSTLGILQEAIAQSTAVPITRIVFFPSPEQEIRVADFVVPDRRPRETSAYGGQLSRYDVHIAKMFEITRHECLQSLSSGRRPLDIIIWRYYAGGGNIKMGAYSINCQEARRVANRYGLGQAEPTIITYYRVTTTVNIPILDITASKVDDWKSFIRTLPVEGMD
ncbi:hypothetical protein AmaxDRAFT_4935 [Limnospira maxima CS-328]|uniref:Uncharacterized protein n=1 Tax=Limnospira maxima CS-328 TaxID=513049 RepID=B5W835_LIMMA|nr:hypothetical protein AmaxDRAFT_4935 [Limnospira maxima CS-328]